MIPWTIALLLFLEIPLTAQNILRPDSIFVRIGTGIRALDLHHLEGDTLTWLDPSLPFDSVEYVEPQVLNRLETASRKYRLTRAFGEQIFRDRDLPKKQRGSERYRQLEQFSDKRIEEIMILHTEIGLEDEDEIPVLSRIVDAVQDLHVYTREDVIRKYLLIESGDALSVSLFLENERLIRTLPYIDECRFLLSPSLDNPDRVNVIVLIKDRLAYNIGLGVDNRNNGRLAFNVLNIYGSGNEGREELTLSRNPRPSVMGTYTRVHFDNLSGMFLNVSYEDEQNDLFSHRQIRVRRPLISDIFKYTGGATMGFWSYTDSSIVGEALDYSDMDVWLGRSMNIGRERFRNAKVILSGRYQERAPVDDIPVAVEDVYSVKDMIFSLGLSKRRYYYSNYIFDVGPTEDIPTGYLLSISSGRRTESYRERIYGDIQASRAVYTQDGHYVYGSFQTAVWQNPDGSTADGIYRFDQLHFSPMRKDFGRHYRLISRMNYTVGFNRSDSLRLGLYDTILPGTLGVSSVTGTQRFQISGEAVFYQPPLSNGLRGVLVLHGDMAFIAEENEDLFMGKPFWGLNLGYRFKHRQLAFNTIQTGITLIWRKPGEVPAIMFSFSANEVLSFQDFIFPKPDFLILN